MPMSRYLARLRGQVGHELVMLPGVSACIFDEAGRVLLAHHVDSGIWALPGGAVEPDEDPAGAVAREAREELGIVVTLKGSSASPIPTATWCPTSRSFTRAERPGLPWRSTPAKWTRSASWQISTVFLPPDGCLPSTRTRCGGGKSDPLPHPATLRSAAFARVGVSDPRGQACSTRASDARSEATA